MTEKAVISNSTSVGELFDLGFDVKVKRPARKLTRQDFEQRAEYYGALGKARVNTDAKEEAERIHKQIEANEPMAEQGWLPHAPFPTMMSRTSPFLPLPKNRMGQDRHTYQQHEPLKIETSWGSIEYIGPQLSIFDEDALMAVLSCMHIARYRDVLDLTLTNIREETTYEFFGPATRLLEALGLPRSGGTYKRVVDSLRLMTSSRFRIIEGKVKGSRTWTIVSMIELLKYEETEKALRVAISPYFYEIFGLGRVSFVDTKLRCQIKSQVGRAIFRFLESQRGVEWGPGHMDVLSKAINLDGQKPFSIRRTLTRAINEMKQLAYLTQDSGFVHKKRGANIVFLKRATPRRRSKKRKAISNDQKD